MGGHRLPHRPLSFQWRRSAKNFAGNSAYMGRDQLAVWTKSLGASGTQHKRILVGVPMGSATQPNQILMLDYTEGFGDPLVAMLTAPERSRKWSPWMIAANSCALIERANGVAEIFFGSNNSSGKIYQLTPGAFSDDGAAINSFYSTAFLAATGAALSGRNLFGYLTAYVQ